MHDRVGKLFQTLTQPFLENGMSLTLMNKANESQLAAMSRPRVPKSSQMAAKTNKEKNVSLPELRRLEMRGIKIVVPNTNETNTAIQPKIRSQMASFWSLCMAKKKDEVPALNTYKKATIAQFLRLSFRMRVPWLAIVCRLSFFCEHNMLETMFQCQLVDTGATCNVLNFI